MNCCGLGSTANILQTAGAFSNLHFESRPQSPFTPFLEFSLGRGRRARAPGTRAFAGGNRTSEAAV